MKKLTKVCLLIMFSCALTSCSNYTFNKVEPDNKVFISQ